MAGTNIGLKDWLLGWIIPNPNGTSTNTVGILGVTLVDESGNSYTPGVGVSWTPLGYAQDTDLAAAGGLPTVSGSIPAATTVALIQAEGADVRWRDDGVDPTASVGMLLGAGTAFWYRGTFSAFKAIGSGTLNVTFYQEVAE